MSETPVSAPAYTLVLGMNLREQVRIQVRRSSKPNGVHCDILESRVRWLAFCNLRVSVFHAVGQQENRSRIRTWSAQQEAELRAICKPSPILVAPFGVNAPIFLPRMALPDKILLGCAIDTSEGVKSTGTLAVVLKDTSPTRLPTPVESKLHEKRDCIACNSILVRFVESSQDMLPERSKTIITSLVTGLGGTGARFARILKAG